MSFSKHSYVGDMISCVDGEYAELLSWSTDIQAQSLTLIQRTLADARVYRETAGIDFNEERHAELLDFLAGVGKVASELSQQVRDTQEIPVN